ncbi:MAG: LOG family protein [Bacteroidetes bacterium]|nr:LOG family protein [Bacteroidota bacterium]
MKKQPVVTVFGSAKPAEGSEEYLLAYDLGQRLAAAGFSVCNGGYGGTMEALARGAVEERNGSGRSEVRTTGITCTLFGGRQANRWIDLNISTESLFERLEKLLSHGDAYVFLQGGTGTLLELATVWELSNKRMMDRKPVVLLGPFWESLLMTIQREVERDGTEKRMVPTSVVSTPEECIRVLQSQFHREG